MVLFESFLTNDMILVENLLVCIFDRLGGVYETGIGWAWE